MLQIPKKEGYNHSRILIKAAKKASKLLGLLKDERSRLDERHPQHRNIQSLGQGTIKAKNHRKIYIYDVGQATSACCGYQQLHDKDHRKEDHEH